MGEQTPPVGKNESAVLRLCHQGIRLKRDTRMSVMYAEVLNSAKSSVTLQSTDRHGILGQKSTDFQVPWGSWEAERTPHGPADRAVEEQYASPPARDGAPQEPSGILVVGNGRRPAVADAARR